MMNSPTYIQNQKSRMSTSIISRVFNFEISFFLSGETEISVISEIFFGQNYLKLTDFD